MKKGVRVVLETFDPDNKEETLKKSTLIEEAISEPTNLLNLGLSHNSQLELLQKISSLKEFSD